MNTDNSVLYFFEYCIVQFNNHCSNNFNAAVQISPCFTVSRTLRFSTQEETAENIKQWCLGPERLDSS